MVKHGFKAKEKSAMVQTLFKTARPKTKLHHHVYSKNSLTRGSAW